MVKIQIQNQPPYFQDELQQLKIQVQNQPLHVEGQGKEGVNRYRCGAFVLIAYVAISSFAVFFYMDRLSKVYFDKTAPLRHVHILSVLSSLLMVYTALSALGLVYIFRRATSFLKDLGQNRYVRFLGFTFGYSSFFGHVLPMIEIFTHPERHIITFGGLNQLFILVVYWFN